MSESRNPWHDLLTAVLLRAVEDAKLQRTYGLHTSAMKARAQDDALRFLAHAGPLFDLVDIDPSAAAAALGFSWENSQGHDGN